MEKELLYQNISCSYLLNKAPEVDILTWHNFSFCNFCEAVCLLICGSIGHAVPITILVNANLVTDTILLQSKSALLNGSSCTVH